MKNSRMSESPILLALILMIALAVVIGAVIGRRDAAHSPRVHSAK